MIPAPFEYVRAGSVDEAIAALTEHGDDAKVMAGGHSLLPLMKLRLAVPAVLVDISRIPDLSYVRVDGEEVAIGVLADNPDPSDREVREGLEGNLCRCTGYHNIVRAVRAAAQAGPAAGQVPA